VRTERYMGNKSCLLMNRRRQLCALFFSSRRRHTRLVSDWSSDVCSSDLKRYWHSGDGSVWYQIIGVAKTGKYWTIGEAPSPFVWFTVAQRPRGGVDLVAQTEGDPSRMIGVVRDEIKRMDPNLPVTDARTMTEHLRASLAPARGAAAVLGSFGLLALTLAAIGIYGV